MRRPGCIFAWLLLNCVSCPSARAQDTQFLPEVDLQLTLDNHARLYVEAKDDREGGDPHQATFGPSIQIYLKPLLKLKRITLFDLDDSKSRPLVLESGYRIISAPDTSPENRAVESATTHLPLSGQILLTERNRFDLEWKNGAFTWRYRNKVTLERAFPIHSYHLIAYAAAEPFYESQYRKWSTTDLYVGCLLPVGKHVEFNPYYEFENDTGKAPNRQQYYVGLAVQFYFSLEKASN